MEWWMLIFSQQSFFWQSFRVSYTCSSNYSVYDGECTHTHLSHAHVSAHSALTAYFAHLHACHIRAWLKGVEKVFAHVSSLFMSLSPFSWFTYPCCSLTVTSRPLPTTTSLTPTSTSSCRTFPSWKRRTCATPHLHRELWLPGQIRCKHRLRAQEVRQDHFRGWWQDVHQRSEPQFLWLLENHTRTEDFSLLTMFQSSVSHVSHDGFALQIETKKACNRETVARQREIEEKEGFVISAAQSMSRKSQRNGISVSLKGHRKSNSAESQKILFWWMRSPRTSSTKGSTSYYKRKIQIREDYIWISTTWSARIWSEESQNTHWLSLSVSFESQRLQLLELFNGQIKLSERVYLRSDLKM